MIKSMRDHSYGTILAIMTVEVSFSNAYTMRRIVLIVYKLCVITCQYGL